MASLGKAGFASTLTEERERRIKEWAIEEKEAIYQREKKDKADALAENRTYEKTQSAIKRKEDLEDYEKELKLDRQYGKLETSKPTIKNVTPFTGDPVQVVYDGEGRPRSAYRITQDGLISVPLSAAPRAEEDPDESRGLMHWIGQMFSDDDAAPVSNPSKAAPVTQEQKSLGPAGAANAGIAERPVAPQGASTAGRSLDTKEKAEDYIVKLAQALAADLDRAGNGTVQENGEIALAQAIEAAKRFATPDIVQYLDSIDR